MTVYIVMWLDTILEVFGNECDANGFMETYCRDNNIDPDEVMVEEREVKDAANV
jgi:hypothetical protein